MVRLLAFAPLVALCLAQVNGVPEYDTNEIEADGEESFGIATPQINISAAMPASTGSPAQTTSKPASSTASTSAAGASSSAAAPAAPAAPVAGVMSVTQAQSVLNGAIKKANEIKIPSNIAIADPAGHLLAFVRMDGAVLASIDVAIKKAKTVAMFGGKYRSGDLYNATLPTGPLYGLQSTNSGLLFFGGGIPLKLNDKFIGALGVSGGTVEQDLSVANAAAALLK